jgi:hypothetical protein
MPRRVPLAALAVTCLLARTAAADPAADATRQPRTPDHRTLGFGFDLGVPDGVALALEVHPGIDWVRLGAAVTYNGAAPGARIALTLDPVPWRIAPTLTAEGGRAWDGAVPGIQKGPTVGYEYANFHFGLEAGNRAAFRFYLRGGLSWIDAHSANLSVGSGAITAQNPSFTGWVAPTAKLGFAQFF